MVLVATLTGIGAMVIGSALPGRALRGAAKEIAGQLRFTRAQAIATGREQVFELDVIGKRWRAAGEREGELPDAVALRVITARGESPAQDVAAVRTCGAARHGCSSVDGGMRARSVTKRRLRARSSSPQPMSSCTR